MGCSPAAGEMASGGPRCPRLGRCGGATEADGGPRCPADAVFCFTSLRGNVQGEGNTDSVPKNAERRSVRAKGQGPSRTASSCPYAEETLSWLPRLQVSTVFGQVQEGDRGQDSPFPCPHCCCKPSPRWPWLGHGHHAESQGVTGHLVGTQEAHAQGTDSPSAGRPRRLPPAACRHPSAPASGPRVCSGAPGCRGPWGPAWHGLSFVAGCGGREFPVPSWTSSLLSCRAARGKVAAWAGAWPWGRFQQHEDQTWDLGQWLRAPGLSAREWAMTRAGVTVGTRQRTGQQ